jgi:hypothetical protein
MHCAGCTFANMEAMRVVSIARVGGTASFVDCKFQDNYRRGGYVETQVGEVYREEVAIGAEVNIGAVRLDHVTFVNNQARSPLQAHQEDSSETKLDSDVSRQVEIWISGENIVKPGTTKPLPFAPRADFLDSRPLQVDFSSSSTCCLQVLQHYKLITATICLGVGSEPIGSSNVAFQATIFTSRRTHMHRRSFPRFLEAQPRAQEPPTQSWMTHGQPQAPHLLSMMPWEAACGVGLLLPSWLWLCVLWQQACIAEGEDRLRMARYGSLRH